MTPRTKLSQLNLFKIKPQFVNFNLYTDGKKNSEAGLVNIRHSLVPLCKIIVESNFRKSPTVVVTGSMKHDSKNWTFGVLSPRKKMFMQMAGGVSTEYPVHNRFAQIVVGGRFSSKNSLS